MGPIGSSRENSTVIQMKIQKQKFIFELTRSFSSIHVLSISALLRTFRIYEDTLSIMCATKKLVSSPEFLDKAVGHTKQLNSE